VALGGFIGMVIGFATQQVLGQAIAGLFVLLARPIRIGDYVNAAGETGVVEDIASLFTIIRKDDGSLALIPNNSLIGSKIYIIKRETK
jgi:small-conductance mechanosensitive channel